jgi:hypothetical protein
MKAELAAGKFADIYKSVLPSIEADMKGSKRCLAPLIAGLVGRSLATFFKSCCSVGTAVFAGLGSLRPTKRNEMERSGRKVMSPASGAGETVPILVRREGFGACTCPRPSTSGGSVKLG